MKFLMAVILGSSFVSQAFSGAVSSGGREDEVSRFSCVERNPRDERNPYLAELSVKRSEFFQLLVREELGEHLWSGQVEMDERVRCREACEIYKNKRAQVTFNVNTRAPISATFSSPKNVIQFDCDAEEN